jgi:hypothetical protein
MTLERVDAATVVSLLGREKAHAYAELATLEAAARAALGEDRASERASHRAQEIERALDTGRTA